MGAAFLYPVTIAPDPGAHAALIDSLRGMTEAQARATLNAAYSSAPVANLDAMATRTMLLIAAAAVAIVGAIFAAFGDRGPAMRVRPAPDFS
jgi:hypothetical protein